MKQKIRKRGTAIVVTPKGILVAAGRHKVFLLPGGGTNRGESREHAAKRELKEETGLKTVGCKYLFTFNEPKFTDTGKPREIVSLHKVFLIKAIGTPKPSHHDVKYLDYWLPGKNIQLSKSTEIIINAYLQSGAMPW